MLMKPRIGEALGQHRAHGRGEEVQPGGLAARIVLRDQPADRHPRERVEQRQHHGLPHGAADILEVHIDAVRAGRRELFSEVQEPMVDGRVEAQLLDNVAALVGAAGDADGARTAHLGELSDQQAAGPLADATTTVSPGFGLPMRKKARISGKARHAEEQPSPVVIGAFAGSSLRNAAPSQAAWVRQPVRANTMSPRANSRRDRT